MLAEFGYNRVETLPRKELMGNKRPCAEGGLLQGGSHAALRVGWMGLYRIGKWPIKGWMGWMVPQDAGGGAVQQRLVPFFADLWVRLSGGKKAELGLLANGLSARRGIPLLPLSRSTFLTVQVTTLTLTSSLARRGAHRHVGRRADALPEGWGAQG
jgi:hypothetical protein